MRRDTIKALSLLLLAGTLIACGPQATLVPTNLLVPTQAMAATPSPRPTTPPAPATSTTKPTIPPTPTTRPITPPTPTTRPAATTAPVTPVPVPVGFAVYQREPATVQPSVSQEAIAPDLTNVTSAFLFSPQQRDRLAENGFVVSPSDDKEFYVLYEQARYNWEPIFVTSDSLLHTYHLLFDKLLRSLEREQFIPTLLQLNALMLADTANQYEQLRGTALEESARRNVAFFAVTSRLLDPSVSIPDYARDLAEAELALIEAHDGVYPSPLFPALPLGEDYTQYIPRGHYTLGEDLKAYFRAMMWYGRMTFRLGKIEDEGTREETRRALLITQALTADTAAQNLWLAIYEPTVFFVGRSDDLLYGEYQEVMIRVYGGLPDPTAFADEAMLTQFMQEAQKLRPPRILGIVLTGAENVVSATKGLRFMGQRFIPDSYMFGQLIARQVPYRFLPKGLDVLAVMGSERAYAILEQEGDTAYPNYIQNMTRLRSEFSTLTEADWTQNLYWSWLYLFFPLLEKPGQGYPVFMQSQAWLDKSLNTVLGSWTELRHDTILYAKQTYAELGGNPKGPPPDPVPPKGYVEPVPEFYARMAALAGMTRQGLQDRGLVPVVDESSGGQASQLAVAVQSLADLEKLSLELKAMAEKELTGQALSDEEYESIRYYGGALETFTFAAADDYKGYGGSPIPMGEEEPQAAVVADVATGPGGETVLEEGVGRIFSIYAVVPVEGQLVVAKGGVFSYYEFPWPASDRLTDEKWREMLDGGQAPPLPGWTSSYRVEETEEAALRQAVQSFNERLIAALWEPDPYYLELVATGEALERNQAYVQSLQDQGLYEGYHLILLEYLSFDLQDATHAVVTTRETWTSERFRAPAGEEGPIIARRAEHTLGVIYQLEKVDDRWMVSKIQTQGQVPPWEEVSTP